MSLSLTNNSSMDDAEAAIGVLWHHTGQTIGTGLIYNLCTVCGLEPYSRRQDSVALPGYIILRSLLIPNQMKKIRCKE